MSKKQMTKTFLMIFCLVGVNTSRLYGAVAVDSKRKNSIQFEVTAESQRYAYPDFDAMDAEAAEDLSTKAHDKCANAAEVGPRTIEWLTVSQHHFTRIKSFFTCP